METPLATEQHPAGSNDGRVLALVLAPGLFLAGLLYLSGIHQLALGLAGTIFVVAVLLSPEVGLYVYFAGQALDQILLTDPGEILTPGKIIGPFVLLAYVLHPGRVRTPMLVSRPFVVAMLLFGLWGVVTTFWAIVPARSIRTGAQIVVQVLIVVVAIHRLSDRVRVGRAMLFAVLGAAVAALMVLTGFGGSTRYGGATVSELYDPNSLALGMAIGLFAIPAAWWCTTHKSLRIAMLLAAPAIVVAIVMTGSRTSVLLVIAAPLLTPLLLRRAGAVQRTVISIFCALVVVTAVYYAVQAHILPPYAQERLDRLFQRGIDVPAEARFLILIEGLQVYLARPWGVAYGNSAVALGTIVAHGQNVHDNFFSALLEGGPIAALLLIYGLWEAYRRLRGIKQSLLASGAMMLFMVLVLSSLTLYTYPSKYFWIPITFCLVLAEQARREELQQLQTAASQAAAAPTRADLLRKLGPPDAVVY